MTRGQSICSPTSHASRETHRPFEPRHLGNTSKVPAKMGGGQGQRVAYSIPARCPRERTVSPLTRAIAHPLPQKGRGTRCTPVRSQLLVIWPANPQRSQPRAVPCSATRLPVDGIRLIARVGRGECHMACCCNSGSPPPRPLTPPTSSTVIGFRLEPPDRL